MFRMLLSFMAVIVYSAISMDVRAQENSLQDRVSFAERVLRTDSEFQGSLSKSFLLASPEFQTLSNRGNANLIDCIAYLSESGHTYQQRMISILAMHKSDVPGYLAFIGGMMGLLRAGKLLPHEIDLAIAPTLEFSSLLIEHYDDPRIQAALPPLTTAPELSSNIKDFLKRVLTGQALLDVDVFRDNCCTPRK